MVKRRFLTKKQRRRLVANSKVRKQTKEKLIARLNQGMRYGKGPSYDFFPYVKRADPGCKNTEQIQEREVNHHERI